MTTNDYKPCRVCQQEKPLSEFYKRHNGNPYSMCIQCYRAYGNKAYAEKGFIDRHVAVNKSEVLVINRLKENNIPASPGKTLGYRWADVAAWGCVLIECKYSSLRAGMYSWNFSPIQQQEGLRAHLVILCADNGDSVEYYVFDAKDPILSHQDGKRKTGLCYNKNANPRHQHKRVKTPLTEEIMTAHQDRWDLIETYRQQVSAHLTDDLFSDRWRTK